MEKIPEDNFNPALRMIFIRAHSAGSCVIVLSALMAMLTLIVFACTGEFSNDILVRNGSSVAALVFLGVFIRRYSDFHLNGLTEMSLKSIKRTTVFLIIASIVKIAVSMAFIARTIPRGNFVWCYYLAECIVWIAVLIFAIGYYSTKR